MVRRLLHSTTCTPHVELLSTAYVNVVVCQNTIPSGIRAGVLADLYFDVSVSREPSEDLSKLVVKLCVLADAVNRA